MWSCDKFYFLAVGGLGTSEKGVEQSAGKHKNEAGRLGRKYAIQFFNCYVFMSK